ncbi:regulator of chromosome condensation 1/beta-lactamase-inhibitor protein II [Cercophora samala]|uniref:Regulator of chromosome condensation 1/beta-lactamase-inhibitor protein II n=1 Tax=Cercophora samala TaxID=330535 RepID=A0AA39ZNX1_9PEZI|nr:regulator of chromosome condensation 1/beta-lactamase-inhibitor protein II [Cercophora samala]
MSLYATGLNAWSQLDFTTTQKDHQQPDDIFTFTCVLKDKNIDYVRPFPSYTLVYTTTTPLSPTHTAGLIPKLHHHLSTTHPPHYHHFAQASNDTVLLPNHPTNPHPQQYPSLTTLLSHLQPDPSPSFTPLSYPSLTLSQTSPFATGFLALSPPHVLSWGDPRYPPLLSRPITPTSPASLPSPIPDLSSLPTGPIVKLSSSPSGYLLAALTQGHDLYAWGHPSRCSAFYPSLPSSPEPVVIGDDDDDDDDDGKDIKDVAVGQSHIIVLTTDGQIWGRGDNSSGQLGLGRETKLVTEWTRLRGEFDDKKIKGVWAGERNSFILVQP